MSRRILSLICVTLLALVPLRAAVAQQGQRLSLIRDAEIENSIRTMVTPIWRAAGLDPSAVEIMIVQDSTLNAFVAGGQRIFINTGLLMRTERPNQLIGVLAHETGHISGGHLARAQEEMEKLSTLQILEALLGAGAMAGGALGGGGIGRPAPADAGGGGAPGSLMSYLKYTQTQESSADQAAMTFLERTAPVGQGHDRVPARPAARGTHDGRPARPVPVDPSADARRIEAFEQAAARSPYTNTPDSPQFLDMHHRIVAKLMGFISPEHRAAAFLRGRPLGAGALRPRHRALSHRRARLGAADHRRPAQGHPNDPYFHELRGQMLYESGRANEVVPSYRRAVQLLPGVGIVKVDFARALLETNKPENDREAVRNLELAAQTESGSFDLWRLMAAGYSRLNNPGMTSLARAEMAILRGQRAEAQAHAAAAERQLQAGTPAWQRAQDIKAYINSRPRKK